MIDADGSQIGIISRQEALERAAQAGLDLVEVSPQAMPPVARIVDWGKYVYHKQKAKKKQKSQDLKQIRMGLKIGEHDLGIKLKKITDWLHEGHKVRISAVFKGREMAYQTIGHQLLDRVFKNIEDIAVIENEPQLAGRFLTMQVRKK